MIFSNRQSRPPLLCLLIFLAWSGLRATEVGDPVQIRLRLGDLISFTIRDIHAWGLTNDRGESVSYGVVDSLFTSDSSHAFAITRLNNTVELRHSADRFILIFARCVPPSRPPKIPEPLTPHSVTLFYRYDILNGAAFQYDSRLFSSEHLIHRLQFAVAFRQYEKLFARSSFAFGLGYEFQRQDLRFNIVFSYGVFGGRPKSGSRPELSYVTILSPTLSYQMGSLSGIHLAAGFDAFLSRSRDDLPPRLATAFLGVGVQW
jgi:hypothetical protein